VSEPEEYLAPTGEARVEIKEKKSRFLAVVRPATNELEAGALLEYLELEHREASHICWAWRLGSPARERFNECGEPHGTAGRPMLQVLRGRGLSDVVAAVVRWFGGVKLGKGGLARAYSGAVREALSELPTEVRRPTVRLVLATPFDRLGAIRRLVRPPVVSLEEESYGELAQLTLRVERRAETELHETLAGLGVRVISRAHIRRPDESA
jgi:uncharacterized YigZ family protein